MIDPFFLQRQLDVHFSMASVHLSAVLVREGRGLPHFESSHMFQFLDSLLPCLVCVRVKWLTEKGSETRQNKNRLKKKTVSFLFF